MVQALTELEVERKEAKDAKTKAIPLQKRGDYSHPGRQQRHGGTCLGLTAPA